MKRLTKRDSFDGTIELTRETWEPIAPYDEVIEALSKLAAYEETGLEPEEIEIIKNIVGRLATADYPHNFQRERSDIAAYMYWITSILKDAKEWWNGRIKAREEAEKALEGMNNG